MCSVLRKGCLILSCYLQRSQSQSVGEMKSKGWERGPSPVGSLGLKSEGESERLSNDSGPPLVCGPGKTTES